MSSVVLVKPFPLVLDPLFVAGLLVLAGAIGNRILRILCVSRNELEAAERVALCGALGLGVLQYVFLALGALQVLSHVSVGLTLLVLLVLFHSSIRDILGSVGRHLLHLQPAEWEPMVKALAGAVAVVLCIALVQGATPVTDPDGAGYHVTVLKWWMEAKTLIALPTIIYSFWPMGGEMVMGLGFATWSDTSVKVIHWAFGVLTLIALYAGGSRLTNPIGGLVAAGIFLAFAFPQYSWAYIDLGVALYVATACLAWIRWHESDDIRWLRVAALCAGLAATFKLTLVLFGVILVALSLPRLLRKGLASEALRDVFFIGVLAGMPIFPWLFRTWMLTGNPIYPFFHNVFPTPNWSDETAWAFREFFQHYNWGSSRPQWSESFRHGARLGAFFVVLVLTAVCALRLRDTLRRNLVLLAGATTLVSIWSLGLYVRLTLPLWPLLLLCALSLTTPLWTRRDVRLAMPAIAVIALLVALRGSFGSVQDSLAFHAGSLSRMDYVTRRGFNTEMIALANREVPADAIVILYPGHGYYYNFRYLFATPTTQGDIRFDTWEHFNADVDALKVGFVICGEEIRIPPVLPNYPPAANEQAFLRRLVVERGEKIGVAEGDALWRILPRT